MSVKPVVKRIQPIDLAILRNLYRYRVLTTQQIRQKFFKDSNQYVYKKMYVLKNSRWVKAFPITRENGQKLTSGYRLTDTGIALLKQQGDNITHNADDLKVSKATLTYLLTTNDIMVHLHPEWAFRDSREIKNRYNLNRGDMIQGAFVGKGDIDYAFYVLLHHTHEVNINKMVREIKTSNMAHHIIFTKGKSSFDRFIEHAMKNNLMTGGSLCIVPYGFGLRYFKRFSSIEPLVEIMRNYGTIKPVHHPLFDLLIETEKRKETYFVNLLDTDLMKIHTIHRYTNDEYRKDGRRVLVLTHMKRKHQTLLHDIHHVDYLEIDPEKMDTKKMVGSFL